MTGIVECHGNIIAQINVLVIIHAFEQSRNTSDIIHVIQRFYAAILSGILGQAVLTIWISRDHQITSRRRGYDPTSKTILVELGQAAHMVNVAMGDKDKLDVFGIVLERLVVERLGIA